MIGKIVAIVFCAEILFSNEPGVHGNSFFKRVVLNTAMHHDMAFQNFGVAILAYSIQCFQ